MSLLMVKKVTAPVFGAVWTVLAVSVSGGVVISGILICIFSGKIYYQKTIAECPPYTI